MDEGDTSTGRKISIYRTVSLFIAIDIIGLAALGVLPLTVRSALERRGIVPTLMEQDFSGVVIGVILLVCIQQVIGGYRTKKALSLGWSVSRLGLSLLATFSFLMMLAAALKVTGDYSRIWFFSWMIASCSTLPFLRAVMISRRRRALVMGAYVNKALSIGLVSPPLKQSDIRRLTGSLSRAEAPVRVDNVQELQWLVPYIREQSIDEVYVTVPWKLAPEFYKKNQALRNLSTNVFIVPVDDDLSPGLVGARFNGERLQIHVVDRPLDGWARVGKRLMDVSLASVAVAFLAVPMCLVALAIKLDSRGPVLFRQKRRGFNGRVFEVLKFRSMRADVADEGAARQTSKNDDRVTRIGRLIRKTSIDELPQLFNVLKGEMSLVGPRPHALETTAEGSALEEAVSNYAERHRVLPGITGLAQINGVRGEIDSIAKLEKRVRYDVAYIDTRSMALDIEILWRTLLLVFHDPYAY